MADDKKGSEMDWDKISRYRENNRFEVKKAQGGLPGSLWATYSAFANTDGGIILLGVAELPDKSLRVSGLSNPEKMVLEFWNTINNPNKVSVNILSDRNLSIVETDGARIISIEVPRAQRGDKPVYINNNPMTGSYRRNGEGDYRCTKDEVRAMLRDAAECTQDMTVLTKMDLSVFDLESLRRYRTRMEHTRPGHVWEGLDNESFLYRLGAVARGEDEKLHPTGAGLLMFGHEYEIVKEFPQYFLDYQEQLDSSMRWTDRIVSNSGEWSGNIFDFYFRVYNKIVSDTAMPFKLRNGIDRVEDTPVREALREVLANCLIHADYYGTRGLVIVRAVDKITASNPGGLRISVGEALCGGISDPRNASLIKMFNLINIGERAGSGIPSICAAWEKQGWEKPVIEEQFNPDRTILSLLLSPLFSVKPAIKTGDKKMVSKGALRKRMIIEYLSRHQLGRASEIADFLGLKVSQTKVYLNQLVVENGITIEGANRNRVYKLKN